MIISNSRQFIYVHIQKCAGTSVTQALDPLLAWNDIQVGGTEYGEKFQPLFRDRFGLRKHATALEIRQLVGGDIWDRYFKFAFVRNPFARTVSLYTYMNRVVQRHASRSSAARRNPPPLTLALAQAFVTSGDFSQFIRHDKFRKARGAQPQYHFLADEQQRLIVDYVGKVENLEADFAHVASRIYPGKLALWRQNVSQKAGDLKDYYRDEEDVAVVREIYEVDFTNFGYDTELPLPQGSAGQQARLPLRKAV
jgi:hypothetical protein